jgi:uncharacterized OB-fold protein
VGVDQEREMASRPVAEGLFTWPSEQPRLLGGRCRGCDLITFPQQSFCPRCGGAEIGQHEIGATARLWTWTTQEFLPKSPPYIGRESAKDFIPFAIGYLEIPGELRLEARLTDVEFSELAIGLEMTVTTVPFAVDEDGTEVITFAFRPAR